MFNGFSIDIWPILLCKGRLLPLVGFLCWKFLRRGSIHSEYSRLERGACLLETASMSASICELSSQDLGRGFKHVLVQYGDLISLWRSKFLENMGFWHGNFYSNKSRKACVVFYCLEIVSLHLLAYKETISDFHRGFEHLLVAMCPHLSVREVKIWPKSTQNWSDRPISPLLGQRFPLETLSSHCFG